MEHGKSARIVVINFAFYALCSFSVPSRVYAETLEFNQGDVCRKGQGSNPDYVCTRRELCESSAKVEVKNQEHRKSCSSNGSISIVCCQPTTTTVTAQSQRETNQTVAEKKCLKYLELAKSYPKTSTTESISNQSVSYLRSYVGEWIQNRTRQIYNYTVSDDVIAAADTKKFPYMAIIGFGETIENSLWACGGSLISERWILTAAHCKQMGLRQIARWARVGGFDANTADTYDIVERKVHPDYKPPSLYNDVALFKLSTDVVFSSSVTPICLNWDPLRSPAEQTATGRETELSPDGQYVDSVLEIRLLIVPGAQCNVTYFTSNRKQLKSGILDDRMLCAVSSDGKTDTCGGDSGGSLVAADVDRPGIYTQYGITSFGKYCGDKNIPGVYTRVAHYVRWIETTVWPLG